MSLRFCANVNITRYLIEGVGNPSFLVHVFFPTEKKTDCMSLRFCANINITRYLIEASEVPIFKSQNTARGAIVVES